MKTLNLIRHAKAEAKAPSGRDFDRPISDSGKTASIQVAEAAVHNLPENFTIWSSPAKRTTQTAEVFATKLNFALADVNFKNDLYTFICQDLEAAIRDCDPNIDSLVIFGHNEAITDFVNNFGDIYIDNVPTSGFVSISFDTNQWSKIKNGKTTKTIFPRDIQ